MVTVLIALRFLSALACAGRFWCRPSRRPHCFLFSSRGRGTRGEERDWRDYAATLAALGRCLCRITREASGCFWSLAHRCRAVGAGPRGHDLTPQLGACPSRVRTDSHDDAPTSAPPQTPMSVTKIPKHIHITGAMTLNRCHGVHAGRGAGIMCRSRRRPSSNRSERKWSGSSPRCSCVLGGHGGPRSEVQHPGE